VTERPSSGWIRTQATPVAVRVKEHGTYKTKVSLGQLFTLRNGVFEQTAIPEVKVGTRLPVYVDPVDALHVSLAPRATEGGQRYGVLSCGLLLVLGGLGFIVSNKQWRAPHLPVAPPPVCVTAPPTVTQPAPLTARDQLARIDWRQFERVVARILEHLQWQATLLGGANPDGGADIVARENGAIAVVQCKHWRNAQVSVKVVRELLGTKASTGFAAHEAMLFTSGTFTDESLRFARANQVTLFDGDAVVRLVEEIGVGNFPELVEPNRKFCPKCDAPMVRRETARPFWGCSTFPRCRCTLEIEG
jgi:hypothetical protein